MTSALLYVPHWKLRLQAFHVEAYEESEVCLPQHTPHNTTRIIITVVDVTDLFTSSSTTFTVRDDWFDFLQSRKQSRENKRAGPSEIVGGIMFFSSSRIIIVRRPPSFSFSSSTSTSSRTTPYCLSPSAATWSIIFDKYDSFRRI